MAISLTTGGLSLNYRTTGQTSVSGTYPIGTVMVVTPNDSQGVGKTFTFPGTWVYMRGQGNPELGAQFTAYGSIPYLLIRLA